MNNGEIEQRVTDLQTKLLALEAKVEQSREMADQQQKEAKLEDTRTVLCETLGPNSALRKGVGVLLSPTPMCINMNMNI